MTDARRLHVEIRAGDSIRIGDRVVLTLEQKSGQRARLLFVVTGEYEMIDVIRCEGEAQPA